VYGLPRATGDLDLWISTTPENRRRVWRAWSASACRFTSWRRRTSPRKTSDGVDFEEAWPSRLETDVAGQVVPVISRDHLVQNKRASGRPQDLADLAWLEGAGAE
jgi:hypothetical protein